MPEDASSKYLKNTIDELTGNNRPEDMVFFHKETVEKYNDLMSNLAQLRYLPDIFKAVVTNSVDILNAKGGHLLLYRRQSDDFVSVYKHNLPNFFPGLCKRGECIAGRILESGQELIIPDYDTWEGKNDSLPFGDLKVIIGTPISWANRILGVLVVMDKAPRVFSQSDIILVKVISDISAAALERAFLLEKSTSRLREAETLRQAALAVTESLSLNETLERILKQLDRVILFDRAAVQLIQGDSLEFVAARGFPDLVDVLGYKISILVDNPNSKVINTKKPLIVQNFEPGNSPFIHMPDIRSWLGVPLLFRKRAIGMIAVYSTKPNKFNNEDIRLATNFANQVAVAIEHAQLFEAGHDRLQEMHFLLEISRDITSTLNLDNVLDRVLETAIEAIEPAEKGVLHLLDEASGKLVVRANSGFSQESIKAAVFDPGEGYCGWVFSNQTPINLGNTHADPRNKPIDQPDVEQAISALCVPLVVRGKPIGTLTLNNITKYHAFTTQHLNLLMIFAGQAGVAIDNARLYAETQRQLHEQIALREAGMIIASTLDPDVVLNRIAEQMAKAIGSTSAYIVRFTQEKTISQVVAEFISPFASESEKKSDLGVEYEEDITPEWFEKMMNGHHNLSHVDDPKLSGEERNHMIEFGAKTVLYIPLLLKNDLIGYVEMWESRYKREYNPYEIALCKGIAQQAAIALENARLFDEANQRALERGILYEAVTAMTTSVRLDEVFRRTIDMLLRVLKPDHISILLIKPGSNNLLVHASYGYDIGENEWLEYLDDETIPNYVVRTGTPLLIQDYKGNSKPDDTKIASVLCVPLRTGQQLIGALNLESYQPSAFDADNMHLTSILAGHLAVIVENARLVEDLEAEVTAQTSVILAEKEKSETILRNVGDAIAMFGLDMRIQYVNPAFTELTGYSTRQIYDRNIIDLFVEDIYQPEWRTLSTIVAQNGLWQGELVIRRQDGRKYDATFTVAPIFDADGRLIGYVSSHKDISRLKNLDRARQHFLSGVSHQLRTPVTTLKIYANLLRRNRGEKFETYLEILDEQADRLTRLIEDILEITRLDSGQVISSWMPVNIKSLLDDIAAGFMDQADKAGLTIEVRELPPNLPTINGDLVQLGQALSELFENAINFTQPGGKITLFVQVVEQEDQQWLTINVRDTGPGIPVNEQKRIFDRFFRGRIAESGHIPGTGLGLCRATGIIEAHGGRVTMESNVGEGSIFTLWLRTMLEPMEHGSGVDG